MGPTCLPETSVTSYQSTLRNVQKSDDLITYTACAFSKYVVGLVCLPNSLTSFSHMCRGMSAGRVLVMDSMFIADQCTVTYFPWNHIEFL